MIEERVSPLNVAIRCTMRSTRRSNRRRVGDTANTEATKQYETMIEERVSPLKLTILFTMRSD